LYPENHGIVNNAFYDPLYNDYFSLSDPKDQDDARWWFGEPIWNTVELQVRITIEYTNISKGQKAAAIFWPGSEANVSGMHPSYYYKYDSNLPYSARMQQVESYLIYLTVQAIRLATIANRRSAHISMFIHGKCG
jgi:hypothetical protein